MQLNVIALPAQEKKSTLVGRGSHIFRPILTRIYFTRGNENLWWHAIYKYHFLWYKICTKHMIGYL
jgi:hypothetical protein